MFERDCGGLEHESQRCDLDVPLGVFRAQLFAESLHFADVGFLKLRDMRNGDPVAVQIGTGDFLDARQRFAFDGAEFGEVHHR
mgnify:CR=1 FL=1